MIINKTARRTKMATLTQTQFANTIARKVFFYEVQCLKDEESEFAYLNQVLLDIQSNKNNYVYNNTKDNKWYGVESVDFDNGTIEVVLVCCKYKYRPNLINIQQRTERPSPKTDDEGDKEKTHLLIHNNTIAYEQRRNGTAASVFSRFLNQAWNKIGKEIDKDIQSVVLKQVIDTDFLTKIRNANKVKNAKFVVDSSMVGSSFFNFTEDNGVQDESVLEIKAKKRLSIDKDRFVDKLERVFAEGETIKKVTVDIYDEDDNHRIINTEEFSKQITINAIKNEYGEIDSADIFMKLRELV